MNAKEVRAINDEYDKFEGRPVREVITMLWDHGLNRRRAALCVLIDLGRKPPVDPYKLNREDRELMALRGTNGIKPVRNIEPAETLSQRLHAWAKGKGAITYVQAAQAINVTNDQAKHLLTSNAHLFKFWKKIAGTSYYIAL